MINKNWLYIRSSFDEFLIRTSHLLSNFLYGPLLNYTDFAYLLHATTTITRKPYFNSVKPTLTTVVFYFTALI